MIEVDSDNDTLCYCAGTTRQQIKKLLDDGIVDVDRISRITGAASGCGGCEFELQQLIEEYG